MRLTYSLLWRMTIGSTREGNDLPANLQGIWNDVNDVICSYDYHMNINLQMKYFPTYNTDLHFWKMSKDWGFLGSHSLDSLRHRRKSRELIHSSHSEHAIRMDMLRMGFLMMMVACRSSLDSSELQWIHERHQHPSRQDLSMKQEVCFTTNIFSRSWTSNEWESVWEIIELSSYRIALLQLKISESTRRKLRSGSKILFNLSHKFKLAILGKSKNGSLKQH